METYKHPHTCELSRVTTDLFPSHFQLELAMPPVTGSEDFVTPVGDPQTVQSDSAL